ncbi:MAG: hypothetical protein R3B70_11935 [Polyangiaceae bacterium]
MSDDLVFKRLYQRYRKELEFEDEIANRRFIWMQPAQGLMLMAWVNVRAEDAHVRFWVALVGSVSSLLLWKAIVAASDSWREYRNKLFDAFEAEHHALTKAGRPGLRTSEYPAIWRQLNRKNELQPRIRDGALAERYVPVVFGVGWAGLCGYSTLASLQGLGYLASADGPLRFLVVATGTILALLLGWIVIAIARRLSKAARTDPEERIGRKAVSPTEQ